MGKIKIKQNKKHWSQILTTGNIYRGSKLLVGMQIGTAIVAISVER